jgi:hypothetical protein
MSNILLSSVATCNFAAASSINPSSGCAVVSSKHCAHTHTHTHTHCPVLHVEHQFYLSGLIRPVCGYKQRNAMHEGQIKRSIDLVNHTSRQVTAYTGWRRVGEVPNSVWARRVPVSLPLNLCSGGSVPSRCGMVHYVLPLYTATCDGAQQGERE